MLELPEKVCGVRPQIVSFTFSDFKIFTDKEFFRPGGSCDLCTKGKCRCAMTEMESRTPKLTRGRKAEKWKRVETDEEADEEELAKEKRIVTRMQAEMEKEYQGWRKRIEFEMMGVNSKLMTLSSAVKKTGELAAETLLAIERLERRLDEEQEED